MQVHSWLLIVLTKLLFKVQLERRTSLITAAFSNKICCHYGKRMQSCRKKILNFCRRSKSTCRVSYLKGRSLGPVRKSWRDWRTPMSLKFNFFNSRLETLQPTWNNRINSMERNWKKLIDFAKRQNNYRYWDKALLSSFR